MKCVQLAKNEQNYVSFTYPVTGMWLWRTGSDSIYVGGMGACMIVFAPCISVYAMCVCGGGGE